MKQHLYTNKIVFKILGILVLIAFGCVVGMEYQKTITEKCQVCEACQVCEVKECPAPVTCSACVCNEPAKITIQDAQYYSDQKNICEHEALYSQHCRVQLGSREAPRIEEKNCDEGFYAYSDNYGCYCLKRECELSG